MPSRIIKRKKTFRNTHDTSQTEVLAKRDLSSNFQIHRRIAVDVRDVIHISRNNKTTAVVCASVCPMFDVLSSAWVGGAPSRQF